MKEFDEFAQIVDESGNQVAFMIIPHESKKTEPVRIIQANEFWSLVRADKVKYLVYDVVANKYTVHYTDEEIRYLKKKRAAKVLALCDYNLESYFRDDCTFNAGDVFNGRASYTPLLYKSITSFMLMCAGMLYMPFEVNDAYIKQINADSKRKLAHGFTMQIKRVYTNVLFVTLMFPPFEHLTTYGNFQNMLWFLQGNFGYNLDYLRKSQNMANKVFKFGNDVTGAGLFYVDKLAAYLQQMQCNGL